MGKIRNLMQSCQTRELIKTSPDMVCYLEGLPYLKNNYLTTNPSQPFLVNFNDHITAFNASYDIDQMMPVCTISMAVPAHLRYLYQAPGGNNLIKTMMQVQVFVKGYYFANDGNTLFNRVFKGYTSHVTHTDDGKTLLISIQCEGILGFFNMMQIDLSPAIQHSGPMTVTPLTNTLANMSPYAQMAFMFLYPSLTDGFYTNSLAAPTTIQATALTGQNYYDAVQDGLVAKWQPILADICREAHIFGLVQKDIKDVDAFLNDIASASDKRGSKAWSFLSAQTHFFTKVPESEAASTPTSSFPTSVYDVEAIRGLHADMGIGSISLINGGIVTRLEQLRIITSLINYECYQDIDGQIIIKPPLYNLDVTNLGSGTASDAAAKYHKSHPKNDITNANNPFIIHLAEISNEVETEDQGAVRATRMVIQSNTTTDTQFPQAPGSARPTAEFIDLPKLSQFGLREEPARTVPWYVGGDIFGIFAQAASDLARSNRGFRTYSFTMPLRPEIKLGFPLFIPHCDMYGYVKSVSIQYQIGGSATMSVTLDTLRKRPMFPQVQPNANGTPGVIFVAQPNLVLKWTKGSATPGSTSTAVSDPSASPANLNGQQATVPVAPSVTKSSAFSKNPPISPDQQSLLNYQQQVIGSYFALSSDTTDASWRIQPDTGVWSAPNPSSASVFSRLVQGNADFNFYAAIRTTVPYTDEKGYEVLAPFPWGRWLDIKTALQEFTRDGYVYQPDSTNTDFHQTQAVNAFLYAGLSATTGTADPSSELLDALSSLQSYIGVTPTVGETPAQSQSFTDTQRQLTDITTFELDYSGFTPGGADSIIQVEQPPDSLGAAVLVATEAAEQQKVSMFLTGAPPQPDLTLASQIKAATNLSPGAGQIPLTPGQFGALP